MAFQLFFVNLETLYLVRKMGFIASQAWYCNRVSPLQFGNSWVIHVLLYMTKDMVMMQKKLRVEN